LSKDGIRVLTDQSGILSDGFEKKELMTNVIVSDGSRQIIQVERTKNHLMKRGNFFSLETQEKCNFRKKIEKEWDMLKRLPKKKNQPLMLLWDHSEWERGSTG